MLKVTNYVMLFAPLAVLGALASTVAKEGLGIVGVYGVFVGEFYLGLIVLWGILIALGTLIVGPSVLRLVRRIREPVLLAFSTASSEAAYPRTLEELERFGCSNRVASFVLPVGYSFNLDGSMMYCTFAVMFIAQVYGIEVSFGQQVMMIAILMLTSKGIAGRAARLARRRRAPRSRSSTCRKPACCCCSASITSSTWVARRPTSSATASRRRSCRSGKVNCALRTGARSRRQQKHAERTS